MYLILTRIEIHCENPIREVMEREIWYGICSQLIYAHPQSVGYLRYILSSTGKIHSIFCRTSTEGTHLLHVLGQNGSPELRKSCEIVHTNPTNVPSTKARSNTCFDIVRYSFLLRNFIHAHFLCLVRANTFPELNLCWQRQQLNKLTNNECLAKINAVFSFCLIDECKIMEPFGTLRDSVNWYYTDLITTTSIYIPIEWFNVYSELYRMGER